MNKILMVLVGLSLALPLSAPAEIYKWKDKSGKMQYSDSPPMTNTPYTTLSGKKPPQAPAAPAANGDVAPAAADPAKGGKQPMPPGGPQAPSDPNASKDKIPEELKEKAAKEAAAKKQEEEKKAADAKQKEQACKAARSRLAQFEQGGRIYRVNEKGEREYYGDKEIAAEIQNAKDDVAANCQ